MKFKSFQKNWHFISLKGKEEYSKLGYYDWKDAPSGKISLAWLLGYYDGDGSYKAGRTGLIIAVNERF